MDLGRAWVAPLLLSTLSCSWSRFDEVGENSPVVLLKRPKEIRSGFGSSLVGWGTEERAVLLVGGSPGRSTGARYDLGLATRPGVEAVGTGFCRSQGSQICNLAASLAAVGPQPLSNGEAARECYAVGVGTTERDPPRGVIIECDTRRGERVFYSLPVPDAFGTHLARSLTAGEPEIVGFAASGSASRALVVGSGRRRLAWSYSSADSRAQPQELVPDAEVENDYGQTVASVDLGDERLVAVGAPERGNVHLFTFEPDDSARYLGCLGGVPGFGRALAVGPVTRGDEDPELVIAGGSSVRVFDARALLELGAGGAECTLDSLPEGALVTSLGCGSDEDTSGCEAADFGYSVAVGDLDGDGDGEVAVGAPEMRVRDVKQAGAVLIYDVEPGSLAELSDVRFVSSAEQEDLLGSSLAVARLEDRDLLAAGARGTGKIALFYCLDLLPSDLQGARCR